ncbi:pre-mRNA-splicing factor 18-like [Lingula anatina]|uniref:Pre-mRNA-splicing factor 18 n=1 Tax=Lingula anatina TaxID=7574 RepID=A0A1S3ICY0_LINAN|nr:pre-mRNA-splicing factor 18-like [Lingula anatina]|eukprot:XP_013396115.1 pre-mRNA-splicing factor 18-like [Lingula anatina]
MDFIKAEIERKKRQLENKELVTSEKKYFKRGELAAKEAEEYWKKHQRLLPGSSGGSDQNSDSEGNAGKSDLSPEKDKTFILPRKEVIRRLRERVEPITLFGETEYEAYQRLRKLEILEPDVNKGYKNDLKAAMDKVDSDYLQEILKSGGDDDKKSNDVKVMQVEITGDDFKKMREELETCNHEKAQGILLEYLQYILYLWGTDLNNRPEEEKRSTRGKLASATHSQTVSYLKPLFRKLKQRRMQTDILECLIEITKFLLERDYIRASDHYYEMAIGNAPWPVGVTMVGIHARTGREKISSRFVAHVLNDETQRKYIQALKRLMTYCQRFFPTDPSRMVDYEKSYHQ